MGQNSDVKMTDLGGLDLSKLIPLLPSWVTTPAILGWMCRRATDHTIIFRGTTDREIEVLGFHLFWYKAYYILKSLHSVQMRATSHNNFEHYMFTICNPMRAPGNSDPCDR